MEGRVLIFTDFETTGVTEELAHPLEVAMIFTDAKGVQYDEYQSYIKPPDEVDLDSEQYAEALEVNGLDKELIEKNGKPAYKVATQILIKLITAATKDTESEPKPAILVSDNPVFDLRMLQKLWQQARIPEWGGPVAKLLHYHMLDMWSISKVFGVPLEEKPHKAMDDARILQDYYSTHVAEKVVA